MLFSVELVKMQMFDIVSSSELTKLLIAVLVICVVCVAWWTTGITDPPHIRTIFLVERRRPINRSNLTTHVESSSIVENPQLEEIDSTTVRSTNSIESHISEENKPPEASTSNVVISEPPNCVEEEESREIIRIMDADPNVVRRRRLAFLENRQRESHTSTSTAEPTDREPETNKLEEDTPLPSAPPIPSSIRIKLKYLNDDLKLVDGRLEEMLGDFKRRHFEVELSSNKIVRLIFNGQVLQSDQETLQSCGMFDNCVVHCLVHQQRNNESGRGDAMGGAQSQRSYTATNSNNDSNNQGRDWDFGNLLFVTVSLLLISAWYFRYEYAHLYTVTATVALVAITGIFTILLVGLYFPDQQQPQPRLQIHT